MANTHNSEHTQRWTHTTMNMHNSKHTQQRTCIMMDTPTTNTPTPPQMLMPPRATTNGPTPAQTLTSRTTEHASRYNGHASTWMPLFFFHHYHQCHFVILVATRQQWWITATTYPVHLHLALMVSYSYILTCYNGQCCAFILSVRHQPFFL